MELGLDSVFANPARKVVTAHRGLSGVRPENTLPAFQAAVAAGTDIIEFDVRDTKDGVPVILHDAKLDRTTNGAGPVVASSWAAVRELEASYWQGTHDRGQRLAAPAEPGTRIPSFEQVFSSAANCTAAGEVAIWFRMDWGIFEKTRLPHLDRCARYRLR